MTPMPNPFINPDYRPEPDLEALEREIMSILPQLNGAVNEAPPAFIGDPSPEYLGIFETLAEYTR
jgi:hypothetical protein